MASRKAMSQTLGLIVGASVFMMAALTLIVMLEGGVMSASADVDAEACNSNLDTFCGSGIDRVPGSCVQNGQTVSGITGLPGGVDAGNVDMTSVCNNR